MTCYHPLHGYRGPANENGKRPIIWKAPQGTEQLTVPCGSCIGCRLDRSLQWAVRCVHEASLYEKNCFLTLTYDNEHLPEGGSLMLSDFQKFLKKLRKENGHKIRYFHCGEYGEKLRRPHYHALLFNHDFDDKYEWRIENGNKLYRSPGLEKLWDLGNSEIGDVTFASAAYVARYVMKKVGGNGADDHYVDKRSGELLKPEYVTMSRRDGIGKKWYEKFKSDVFPSDEIRVEGKKVKVPRFYDNLLDKEDPDLLESIKNLRVEKVPRWHREMSKGKVVFVDEFGPERMKVKEEVKTLSIKKLIRPLEGL